MFSLRSRRGRSRSRLEAREFLHQAVAQGAQGVGLAGAGQSEGHYVDSAP